MPRKKSRLRWGSMPLIRASHNSMLDYSATMRLAAVTRPDDHAEKVETVSEGSPTATLSSENVTARSAIPVSTSEIDRRVRTLPTGTIETFTRSIQPMLLNYCATAGCHGASGTSSYALYGQHKDCHHRCD